MIILKNEMIFFYSSTKHSDLSHLILGNTVKKLREAGKISV